MAGTDLVHYCIDDKKLIDLQAIKSYRSMSECRKCELPEGPRLAESENKAPAFMK